LRKTITVAAPFYDYGGQLHRWFEGDDLVNLGGLYTKAIIRALSSFPGCYSWHFLPLAFLLPITAALGFIGLAILGSVAALIAFEAAFRAVQRGIMRPARETLFTIVPRADRYKAKAFIDTFVYRSGDVIGAQTEGLLGDGRMRP
jgi:ATP/ADP translocase